MKSLDIQILVSSFYGLTVDSLHSKSRCAREVRARHVAMYLVRERGLSYPRIGSLFERGHATVHYACRKVAEDFGALRDEVAAIRAMMSSA